jgi:DNA (cytosine-5)-methyltransferase 1
MAIPIIDLFAGPGGLSEGFSCLSDANGQPTFTVLLSVEKDFFAHQTLQLRSFFRCFAKQEVPQEYYDYVKGTLPRQELFARFPEENDAASREAWLAELGSKHTPNQLVDRRIRGALGKPSKWVLIGGPPCQAYSLVGRSRIRGASIEKYETDHRHFLYREYLRILAQHAPPVFVMENVKGLLSAKVNDQSIFARVIADLRRPRRLFATYHDKEPLEYRLISIVTPNSNLLGEFQPEQFVVKSERYGIPQARHRVIILGIRSDIKKRSGLLSESSAPSIDDVIGDLPKLRSGLSQSADTTPAWRDAITEITKRDWFLNGAIDETMRQAMWNATYRLNKNLERGAEYMHSERRPRCFPQWYFDPRLGGVLNHSSRGHIQEDLHRYLYAAVYAQENGRSPLLQDFPKNLLPNHRNVRQALKETKFNDRFRVQVRGRPATTIVSHIAKDGHYFIHYDPAQCRSLTVREAARLQTFPDNYFFEGPRTEQYKQVGNAVPPLLARQIAEIVADLLN